MRGYTKDSILENAILSYEDKTGYKPLYAIVPKGYSYTETYGLLEIKEVSNTQVIYLDHERIEWDAKS